MKHLWPGLLPGVLLLPTAGNGAASSTARAEARLIGPLDDEVVGPFCDWVNVKEAFGAVGDGQADKASTMLSLNGVRHACFGLITWDGAGKALAAVEHEWDRKVTGAATLLEHEDEVFRDVGFGLRGGNMSNGSMDAEMVVKRCHFLRNTQEHRQPE